MADSSNKETSRFPTPISAQGEEELFGQGDLVRVATRYPIGHYRVPRYIRGKIGTVESVIVPRAVNNEEEGFGRNAGSKRHYYRIVFSMAELWQGYSGAATDRLKIEVFETWLERR